MTTCSFAREPRPAYSHTDREVRALAEDVEVAPADLQVLADIVDPHLLSEEFAFERARGLARFAADHSDKFGRIELIIVEGEKVKRLNLVNSEMRDRVAQVSSHAHLRDIFNQE